VLAEDELAHGYPGRVSADDVRNWWRRTDLGENSWACEEARGLVALGWLECYGDDAISGGAVHPTAKGRGLGAELVEISERRARALGGSCFRQMTLGADEAARSLFESRGFREVRRHYVMAIELESEPPEPMLPAGLKIDTFREDEASSFQAALSEAFADEWGFHSLPFAEWWAMRRADDKSLWFLVRDGQEIAACARCEPMLGGGSIGALAVRKPWRRRGLGRALLLHAFREFHRRGYERVSLGVDSENPTGATRLYASVGMHVESEHITFEKELA
jgi:ribosomal protein S18 acetylase RimI-like enzyme